MDERSPSTQPACRTEVRLPTRTRGPLRGGGVLLVCGLLLLAGCHRWDRPVVPSTPPESQYFQEMSRNVIYSAPEDPIPGGSVLTDPPRNVREPRPEDIWPLSLDEVVQMAVANVAIVRQDQQFLARGSALLANPDQIASAFDPQIQNSGVLFGQRGEYAALSDFTPQYSSSMTWGRDELVQNNLFLSGGLPPGATLTDETGNFQSRIEQTLPGGGTFAIRHDWLYSGSNAPARLFQSAYTGFIGAEFRQPLWAGAGADFTSVAGPVGQRVRGVNGVAQGIIIARLNNNISLVDFESSVLNLIKDVHDVYWDLYLAYREYEAEVIVRESSERTWDELRAKLEAGAEGGKLADEAQAADTFFETRARSEQSLANIYITEGRLRRLIGMQVNDSRLIRPADTPVTRELVPDWETFLGDAMTRRIELRRQKMNIDSYWLQAQAARSLVNPRLDFVSAYRVNGFGDRLLGSGDDDGTTGQGYHDAYESIEQGNQTSWTLGVELSAPLGFLNERAQLRNIELRLVKARAALAAQEIEISHELANSFRTFQRGYLTMQSFLQRQKAAQKRVDATYSDYRTAGGSIDLLLRARISLAQAQIAYQRSIVEYNKSITDIHYRKGTLFEYNAVRIHNVHPPKPPGPRAPELPPRRGPEPPPPRRAPMAFDERRYPAAPLSAAPAAAAPPSDAVPPPTFDREFEAAPLPMSVPAEPAPTASGDNALPPQRIPPRRQSPRPENPVFLPARPPE